MDINDFLSILGPPDNPDGQHLSVTDDDIIGAGFRVPIVNGRPDFISYAPMTRKSLDFPVPDVKRPPASILKARPKLRDVPEWFKERDTKFGPLSAHEKGWLLDIGAGYGNRSTYERLGYRYIGIDADAAGRHSFSWGKEAPGLHVICDAHRLPFRSNSIEAVNSTAVFEHLYNPPLAAREIARVLAPGGLLVGSCSFLEGEHFDSQFHMTALALYRLFSNAGLEVTALYPAESLWQLHASNVFPGVPFAKGLAAIAEQLYYLGVRVKSKEPVLTRRFRLSAIIEFQAVKPRDTSV